MQATAFHRSMRKARDEGRVSTTYLTYDQLNDVKELYALDDDDQLIAFQRPPRPKAVKEATALAEAGVIFPAIYVAKIKHPGRTQQITVDETVVKNGDLVMVDGQTRRTASLNAGIGIEALVVECSLDEAKQLFLLHNTRMTRVKRKHCLKISGNPQATTIRELAEEFGADHQQIRRLMDGVAAGMKTSGLDFVDLNATFSDEEVKWAKAVLKVWTDSKLWKATDSSPRNGFIHEDLYSGLGTMHILGILTREEMRAPRKSLNALLGEIKNFKYSDWHPRNQYGSTYGSSISDLLNLLPIVRKLAAGKGKMNKIQHTRPPKLRSRWKDGATV